MFKNMNKVFNEISVGCKQLFIQNNLIKSDCPYKCLGNASFSKKYSHPFSNGVEDQNYLLGCMWSYLVGLFLVPKKFSYVGSHFPWA
jgi:hypothetical protein